jgi:hypothetical protein
MYKITPTVKLNLLNNQSYARSIFRESFSVDLNVTNKVHEKLVAEACETFFKYLELLGLANEANLIVLPSTHHYYYDADEMKEVRAVVNMKHLNHIKDIKDFIHSIYHILSHQSFFIGTFIDRKNQNGLFSDSTANKYTIEGKTDAVENGIESRIPLLNMMYNFMDSRTNRHLSKQAVSLMLGEAGFKVLDMTELNGLTYFCIQKVKPSEE